MRAIIVEDEVNVRAGFVKMLNKFCSEVEIVAEAGGVDQGYKVIKEHDFEVLFLDINLPDGTGFDLLNRLGTTSFDVIFITAYDQYALDAFKISASDYLMKPVSPIELKRSISQLTQNKTNRVLSQQVLIDRINTSYKQEDKIIIRNTESLELVSVSDINYCQAEGSYTSIHLREKSKLTASLNLKEYERLLQPYGFERAHHSYLVNLNHIQSMNKIESYLIMKNDANIPLSQRKKSKVMLALEKRFLG